MPHPILTRKEVLEAIRIRYVLGQPLVGVGKPCQGLYTAARTWFGSWFDALQAASLPATLPQRWTHERILDAIRHRHRHGPPLKRAWRDNRPLFRAAVHYFGNWHTALRAAGLAVTSPRRWSRERVLQALQDHYRRGQLHIRAFDSGLANAGWRYFGSLNNALEAAGLPPRPDRWTARKVIDTIQNYYVKGLPIAFRGFRDGYLAAAADRYFGNWRAAVAAAGLLHRMPERKATRCWSPPAVLNAIRAWNRQGIPLKSLWSKDTGLYSAAKKHFGSWRNAVLSAGLDPGSKAWTRQLVLQEIRSYHEQGRSLSTTAAFRDASTLAGAATRMFGSWKKALQAAGIRVASPQPSCRPAKNRRSA